MLLPVLACSALLAAWVATAEEGEAAPPSPCPEVFQYSHDGGRWLGVLRVPVPDQPRRMVVVASLFVVDTLLPPEHPGELQLLQDESKVKGKIKIGEMKTVVYVLELPSQDPLPVVDKIKINRNIICQGPSVKARNRTKVTYTHRLNGLRPLSSNQQDEGSNIKQGRMLDKNYNIYKVMGGGNEFGSKGKGNAYNTLELTENEVVDVITHEEDIFPKYKHEGRHFDGEFDQVDLPNDEDLELSNSPEVLNEDDEGNNEDFGLKGRLNGNSDENIPADYLSPSEEAEVLADSSPDDTKPVGGETSTSKTPAVKDDSDLEGSDVDETSENTDDPNEDAEVLDGHKSEDDDEDESEEDEVDRASEEADSTMEDVEMIDNKISEAEHARPKHPEPGFKTGFNGEDFEDFTDNELNPIYNSDMPDNVIYP